MIIMKRRLSDWDTAINFKSKKMKNKNTVDSVQEFVSKLLSDKLSSDIYFHTPTHTREVVKAAVEIARECDFTQDQLEIVTLAAWFHDCDYTAVYTNHEDQSKIIAKNFLSVQNYPNNKIEKVLDCIEATRFPQNPKSAEGEVLSDADLYHFTKPDYLKYEQRLRKEFEIHLGKTYTDQEWAETNYNLLKNHCYYTGYGKNVLQKFKEVNIERLKNELNQ